jgi:hypothetical protein
VPRRALALIAVLAALAGCGDRRLVVHVDVLSYLDPSLTRVDVGPVPALPGGFASGEQEIVKDRELNLVDGTGNVSSVEDVSISMSAMAADSTGSGTDTLRLYLSDIGADPLDSPPVLTLPVAFVPGVTDTVEAELSADARVTALFAGKRLRATLTTSLRGPDSGDDLNARLRVLRLDAVVIASRKNSL